MDCESDSDMEIYRSLYDIYMENQLREFPEKTLENLYDDKKNFAAKLRWLRWKIYQKVENKISTAVDVEKYEELVNKFVSKFETTQLSDWEVSIWKNKVLKTKNDVHAVILRNNSEASVDLSEVSSQESLCDEDDNEPEVASVSQFFDKANAYENLCSNLPNVPELEDPDEEIEKRLWRLKERDNTDDFETDFDMFGKHKHEETESKTNQLEVKDTETDKTEADIFDDEIEAMGKIKNPVSLNNSVQYKESVPNCTDVFDTNKEEFNDWYESQLKKKLRKSNVRVLSEEPPGPIYSSNSSRLDDNMEYKQLFATSSDSHVQGGDNKAPDLLCFLQAYFVLLISTCKTLNEAIEKFSHSSCPVIPYQPIQPTPLSVRTSRFTPRSMYCECTADIRGLVTFSEMTTTATVGASVFYKWMRLQLQHLKENVILTILSVGVGEQFESIEELKRTRVKSESIK